MNRDFIDLLESLLAERSRFLIVGAHAMAAHGVPRATGDLDVWVEASPDNASRVWRALETFGAPVEALGLSRSDLEVAEVVFQMGQPPRRIDLLTTIDGVSFDQAWPNRFHRELEGLEIPFVSLDDLITNKVASARPKDLVDVELLRKRSG